MYMITPHDRHTSHTCGDDCKMYMITPQDLHTAQACGDD